MLILWSGGHGYFNILYTVKLLNSFSQLVPRGPGTLRHPNNNNNDNNNNK